MTKKEYCLTHEPIAGHNYFYFQLHGIENGFAYISKIYKTHPIFDGLDISFHRLKVYQNAEKDNFVRFPDGFCGKINLDTEFVCNPVFHCNELKNIVSRGAK